MRTRLIINLWEDNYKGIINAEVLSIVFGASGRIRTFDRSVRSRVLYPAELRMRSNFHDILIKKLELLALMVHPEGFEPSTARFVAEYSIQLSYGCIKWRRVRDSNPR